MKHAKLAAVALAVSLGGLAVSQSALAEVTRGQLMAKTCLACHGSVAGGPDATIPSLVNGYPRQLMIQNMKAFRDGTRAATVMNRHALGYTDEEIALLADYFDTTRR
ncbi:c-type cytochrome [Thioalkalivibrio sulfidiphilus]|uniref:c-type cytochrome n=1 Tax=Thioalkalivibrio sulfidiphilus TaxID=1033854 RepID=UPI0003626B6E|nr:cytochrome c [Thioalkalivibrio sulfidiphilus]